MSWIKDLISPETRPGEEFYRNRWQHDRIVRSTRGVNCTKLPLVERAIRAPSYYAQLDMEQDNLGEKTSTKTRWRCIMPNKTSINHKFFGTLRVLLVFCALGMFFSLSALAQDQERRGKPEAKVVERGATQTKRLVIAPASVSIPDESALTRALLPFSVPPDPLTVVLKDGTAVVVRDLEWVPTEISSGMPTAKQKGDGMRYCDCGKDLGRHLCPNSWTCADCCDVIRKAFEYRMLPRNRQSEVDKALLQVNLRIGSAPKKKYPLDLGLFDPKPEQTISCMEKDAQGNCIHWRICGTTTSGVYKCYDVVKDPAFGWVVTWK